MRQVDECVVTHEDGFLASSAVGGTSDLFGSMLRRCICRDTGELFSGFKTEGEIAVSKAWNEKDERQYEAIKDSAIERGRSAKRAKELAARTVNKQRRIEGRTPNRTTQGTGNPRLRLEDRSVLELRNLASKKNIPGRSKMRKDALIAALRE